MAAEYLRVLRKFRRRILNYAVAGAVLALLSGVGTQPIYRTRTSVDIRSVNSDFMGIRSVAPTGGSSSDDVNTNLQTQIKLLQSDSLLGQVADKMRGQPHLGFIVRDDLLSQLGRLLHVGGNTPIPYGDVVDYALLHVKVKALGLTRLVEITCDSWDRRFSAEFCNNLTSTFQEQDLKSRAVEAEQTQDWLTRQVADVRLRAQESQKRLEEAVGGNGLMLSLSTITAGEDRMRALQSELVRAQADRITKQASAALADTADAQSLPNVQDNPTHRVYELKVADLQSQLSQLLPALTEDNPRVIRLRAQIQDAQNGLNSTASSSTLRQENEYYSAEHRESLLDSAFKAQKAVVSSDLQKAAQVSLLRRELDSDQMLYQTLLQRAKEAGFAAAMPAATIRVIDAAGVPRVAYSPQRLLAAGLGFALGGLLGIGLSFYRERNNNLLCVPGDASRLLHVYELGVIPANEVRKITANGTHNSVTLKTRNSLQDRPYGVAIRDTHWDDSFSIAAESYRNATLSILLSGQSKRSRTYVVSSPNVGEGKTTVTSNLGVSLGRSKLRVVLIDGDLRRPKLHVAFAIANGFGLRNILRGELDLENAGIEILTHQVGVPNVSIIPAGEGKEDVVELLHSPHFNALLTRLSRDFDVILIDSPPILHMADARILAAKTDGTILIFRAGITTRENARSARDLIHSDGMPLIGTILNDFDPVSEGKPSYYSSYHQYGKSEEDSSMWASR